MLTICHFNFTVGWITLPHSEHGFFKYFYTKLVDHKYHIPDFSSKWTNFMSYELFSSSNQDIDLKVTFLRFDNSYLYSFQGVDPCHKYNIPTFSLKWTNSMSYEVFSSSNQDTDQKVTFLRFDNNYIYSFQGLNFPIDIDAVFSIHVFFSYVQLTS